MLPGRPRTALKRHVVRNHERTNVRKRQIVDAARDIIIKRGSEHLTVRALAKSVGLTEGALYRHFRSKRDILALLVEDIQERWLDEIGDADDGRSALEVLDVIVQSRLEGIQRRRGSSFLVIAEIMSLGDKRLNRIASLAIDKYVQRVQVIFDRGVKDGDFREDLDTSAAALLFFTSIHGLVNVWALGDYDFDLVEGHRPIWKLFLNAILKRPCQTPVLTGSEMIKVRARDAAGP